ncbi:uncharacterized protein LOC142586877 isoform X1 [Dermacentor variabilis]|uniref:uncharacterized protein LOC142586877 isoform X1 n=1 Tax=Dermacentor variabilis TaxID=34621 RepID=UPI003F5B2F8C
MLHKAILLAIFVMLSPDLWLPVRISTVVHMHSLSIKEFVNTSEPIWTYKTTEIPQIRCLSHLMRSIHPMFIEFNRTHLYRNRVVRLAQRGQFSTALPERMTITDMGGLRMSVEYLLYKAPDSSCAVVKVRCSFDRMLDHYDLRVRNSSVTAGPRQMCKRWFSQVAPHGRVIYNRNCERLLRPRE